MRGSAIPTGRKMQCVANDVEQALSNLARGRGARQQSSFCGARLCAKHQPQRTNTPNAWICADVLRLVETTQPRSVAK